MAEVGAFGARMCHCMPGQIYRKLPTDYEINNRPNLAELAMVLPVVHLLPIRQNMGSQWHKIPLESWSYFSIVACSKVVRYLCPNSK